MYNEALTADEVHLLRTTPSLIRLPTGSDYQGAEFSHGVMDRIYNNFPLVSCWNCFELKSHSDLLMQ